jgi:hypothetical protein
MQIDWRQKERWIAPPSPDSRQTTKKIYFFWQLWDRNFNLSKRLKNVSTILWKSFYFVQTKRIGPCRAAKVSEICIPKSLSRNKNVLETDYYTSYRGVNFISRSDNLFFSFRDNLKLFRQSIEKRYWRKFLKFMNV